MCPCSQSPSHNFNPCVNPLSVGCDICHAPGLVRGGGKEGCFWSDGLYGRLIISLTGCPPQSQVTLQFPISFLVNKNMCEASSGEVSTVMQMGSDGEGMRMLIESQTVFPGSDFRLEGTVLFLLNPTAVTQPNLSLYQDTHSFWWPSGGKNSFLLLPLHDCRDTLTTLSALFGLAGDYQEQGMCWSGCKGQTGHSLS